MNLSFDNSIHGLTILILVILAGGISYYLYFRNNENLNLTNSQKGFLSVLRFLSLAFIFLFLLSPIIRHERKIRQKPILAIAVDNSQSAKDYLPVVNSMIESIRKDIPDDYELEYWSFGERVRQTDTFDATDRRSDYSMLLKSMKQTYSTKNIGAVILLGDGIFNQGQDPENLISGINIPYYTIGIGDTTRIADAAVTNVRVNKTTFLKNKFPLEIEFKFDRLKNQMAYFEIENNKKTVYSGTIPVDSDDAFKLEYLNLDATIAGLQHYTIRIKPMNGETKLKNNEYVFVIQVIENKQKILIVSDGPHPDLGAIRNSLDELHNYEVRMIAGNELPDSLETFSLLIINQLPTLKNSASTLLRKVKDDRIPVLFLIGTTTLTEQLNALNMGINIASSQNSEAVQPVFNPEFTLFTLSDELKTVFSTSPPLIAPFGNTTLGSQFQNLAFQGIRTIATSKPMIALGTEKGRRTGFIVGEGIWRWRLSAYQETGQHDAFNELIQKSIQYLARKENEDNFNVYFQSVYQETDQPEFSAVLYNDSYEMVNTPDVTFLLTNDSLKEFNYQFDRVDDYYKLNAGNLNPGDYTFLAETMLGNQHFRETGKFTVLKNEIEIQNKKANYKLLYQLSQQTGGLFFTHENYGTLLDSLKADKQIAVQQFRQTSETELIDLKTFFIILVLLLSTEWFFRKYWGIY